MRNTLDVTIDPGSGFCFGVVFAIEMAEQILRAEGQLYCLGDIVHNDEEVNRLAKMGLKVIDHEALGKLRDAKVLIRAHGEPPSTYRTALENNLELVDASCPVVLKLQNRIRNAYGRGENLMVFGKKGHAEVLGLLGQVNHDATVFQDVAELDEDNLPEKISIYSQTTKSTDKFYNAVNWLKEKGVEVSVNDTICRQVSNRDRELRNFAKRFDKIVFVAGTKSSNGKVLYNVCKSVNENTHLVSRTSEIQTSWFQKGDKIGVCGATSTPMWLMRAVKEKVESFSLHG
ncbi:4-hydroxy-3-methylbut-2-enyl diphosphate reductase [Fulvitalea axinellae]